VGIRPLTIAAVMAAALFVGAGCGRDDNSSSGTTAATGGGGQSLSGRIEVDGSSTVGPFVTAGAEDFQAQNSGVQVTVGISGTGGGFERFCAGETDISDASRPIKDDEEVPVCQKNGIEYTQIQIANDGIAVVVNNDNDWATCLTVDQLKKIWEPKSKVNNWNQVDSSFPDQKMTLAGPGTDSGTFDFFTDVINGEEDASRTDYQATEDDNVTVQAVEGDKGGLGYFGFSYYEGAQDKLNLVGVDDGSGTCVKPSKETIQDGSYKPLSRPLFMYPSEKAMKRPEVKAFMDFTVANADKIAEAAKIVPLTSEQITKAKSELSKAEQGAG
jgi:phosphate transport system substrate-binding protein